MKNIDEKRKIVLKEDLIKGFKEAGVRELSRMISKILRKIVKKRLIENSSDLVTVTKETLEDYLNIPVVMQDERLTTVAAHNYLLEANLSRKKRKKVVDKMAANIILQTYLDIEKGK